MGGLLGQLAGGLLGGGGGGGMAQILLGLLQSQPGGLAGLVQGFQSKGMGDIVNSWVGTGANMPVSPQQIEQGLGGDMLSKIAAQLGVSPQIASTGLSQLLPNMVDKLTPQGQVPQQQDVMASAMSVIQGLLK
jgi:uncharacterized protein YidB (DUF937 family)